MPNKELEFIQSLESRNFNDFNKIITSYHKAHQLSYNTSLIDSLNTLNENHTLYQRAIDYLLELGYEKDKLIEVCQSNGRDHRTLSEEIYDHTCDILGFKNSDGSD
jgi:hypothetical protein